MDNFLSKCRLPKLPLLERENLNRPIFMEELERAIKEPHHKESTRATLFCMGILPNLQSPNSSSAL